MANEINEKKYASLNTLQTFKENLDNTFATKISVDNKIEEKIPSDSRMIRSFTTSGSGSLYTATINNYTSYTKGDVFVMIPHTIAENTSPQLNINGLGAKYIRRMAYGGTKTSLQLRQDLYSQQPQILVYDGTDFIMVGYKQPDGDDINITIPFEKLPESTMFFAGEVNKLSEVSNMKIGYTYKPTIIKESGLLRLTISDVTNIVSGMVDADIEGEDDGLDAVISFSANNDMVEFLKIICDNALGNWGYWSIAIGEQVWSNAVVHFYNEESESVYIKIHTSFTVEQAQQIFVNGNTAICTIADTSLLSSELQEKTENQVITNDNEQLYMYNGYKFIPLGGSTDGLATEVYVDTKVASMVDSAPETLNTLNELAAALGDDPNFATTVATQIGGKADAEHTHNISDMDDYVHEIGTIWGDMGDLRYTLEASIAQKAPISHNHDDIYYTKTQIDNLELITVNDIDNICGTNVVVQNAEEVSF